MRGSRVAATIAVAAAVAAATLSGMAFAYAWQVVRRARHPDRPSRILAFSPHAAGGPTITIAKYIEAARPGRYGLWFDDDRGYLRVGEVVATHARAVTRRVEAVESGTPFVGATCRLTGSYWRDPAAAGLPYESLAVSGDLGPMPAWFIPGEKPWRSTVILVHGWRSNRLEPLRAVPAIRDAGWSSLVITYRNDIGAPDAPDGKYHLGATEWRDVEAAVRFAQDRGAERIVLAGWSMGGGTVLQTLLRSDLADSVEAVILDSPALDWHAILAAYVRLANYPSPIGPMAEAILSGAQSSRLVGLGEPIPMRELSVRHFAARLDHPVLLLQGEDDPTTPAAIASWFATARPDIVDLERFPRAGHIRAWNADGERYARVVTQWLRRLDARGEREGAGG